MKWRKGNSLIEVMIGMSIIIIAISFIGIGINRFSVITKEEKEKERLENILEIVEKEIKYETSLCEIEEKLKGGNSIFFEVEDSFENEILTTKILDLSNNEKGKIELKKEEELRTALKLKIICKEKSYEKIFEKEKWMEMQGIYID